MIMKDFLASRDKTSVAIEALKRHAENEGFNDLSEHIKTVSEHIRMLEESLSIY